jgi:hypothetical protein
MQLFQLLCQLVLFSTLAICVPVTTEINATITTTNSTEANPLAPSRLELIKDSYSELNLLSKTNPSDFIFDFGNAKTGISTGTGGHSVAATVSISSSTLF